MNKNDTNDRTTKRFYPTLPWEIDGVIEVPNRDTGEGFLIGARTSQRQPHHCKTYSSLAGDCQERQP